MFHAREGLCSLFALLMALATAPVARAAAPKQRTPTACFGAAAPSKGQTLWLASNPHLPLAETRDGSLSPPDDKEGCKRPDRWGAAGRSYRVLDHWGKVVGTSKILRRERYQVSGCDEIVMAGGEGTQGEHLLVSADGVWRPGPSFADSPSAAVRAAFRRFLSGLDERLVGAQAPLAQPDRERVAFFRVGAKGCVPSESEQRSVGSYAVATGPYIVIARYDAKLGWKAVYLSSPPPAVSDDYRENKLLAILDMDEDGLPDVVVHQAEDTAFWDLALGLDAFHVWREVARSAAGGTL